MGAMGMFCMRCMNRNRAHIQGAVVPAAHLYRVGVPAGLGAPAVDGVVLDGGAALAEADGVTHRATVLGLERAVVVGNHQGVLSQAGRGGVTGVFKPVEQAFFQQQPLDEGQVTLLVLGGQTAQGVDAGICHVDAPYRL